jgi:hypothetical protein
MSPLQKPIEHEVHTRASRRTHRTCVRCKCRDDVLHCVFAQSATRGGAGKETQRKTFSLFNLRVLAPCGLCLSIFLQ